MCTRVHKEEKIMLTRTKKFIGISAATTALVLGGVALLSSNIKNGFAFRGYAEFDYSVTFNSSSEQGSLKVGDDDYYYAYNNSVIGNKYGMLCKNTGVTKKSGDVIAMKGTSNFIYFSYGDISSSATYTQAEFPSKVKKVTISAYYEAANDYTLYTRVYYSEDGTWSDSNRKGYTTTKSETTFSFDLTSVNAKYIKIGVSNAYSDYHFTSIQVEYNC